MPLDPRTPTGRHDAEPQDILPRYSIELQQIALRPLPPDLLPGYRPPPAPRAADAPPQLRRTLEQPERESARLPQDGATMDPEEAFGPELLNALSLPHSLASENFSFYLPAISPAEGLVMPQAQDLDVVPTLIGVNQPDAPQHP